MINRWFEFTCHWVHRCSCELYVGVQVGICWQHILLSCAVSVWHLTTDDLCPTCPSTSSQSFKDRTSLLNTHILFRAKPEVCRSLLHARQNVLLCSLHLTVKQNSACIVLCKYALMNEHSCKYWKLEVEFTFHDGSHKTKSAEWKFELNLGKTVATK